MPTKAHYGQVAIRIKRLLNGKDMLTLDRLTITDMIREVSGEESTRLKALMAQDVEAALLGQGIRCFPLLQHTTSGDTIRFFPSDSALSSLIDLLLYPSSGQDVTIGEVVHKARTTLRNVG